MFLMEREELVGWLENQCNTGKRITAMSKAIIIGERHQPGVREEKQGRLIKKVRLKILDIVIFK